jgi:hypothetical protein
LFIVPPDTQRSPISSVNAGLNDFAPLGQKSIFGPHAGYAQQYLFHYVRTKMK